MTWDTEGHLVTVTEDGKTTAHLYAPDGNRLTARNADGSTTAHLPGQGLIKFRSGAVGRATTGWGA
ncbi:hypothetical protein ACGRHY_28845 [Streptomyces sp. HK10]|uniref:hypothetical protein n=1 Tax=Streptomyces sp. HK10 TaxID=3373255 RepID=UPI003748920E